MGAGQIGGIATLLDIDFHNAAGFIGVIPDITEGQYIVMYMSHVMMFCVGTLIEAHVVLTPASCVYGERYKFDVVAGTHRFLEGTGTTRKVQHLCIHKGFNRSAVQEYEWTYDNIALLVLNEQFSFNHKEAGTDFVVNRVRYGVGNIKDDGVFDDATCRYFGWGSRRNGYLIPLLINLRKVAAVILPQEKCKQLFNPENKFLCIQQHPCRSEKFGAMCPRCRLLPYHWDVPPPHGQPDDMGTMLVCSGFARGMMISRLVDRPCGVGFLDLSNYNKFLMCGVDDSRDVIDHENMVSVDVATKATPALATVMRNFTEKKESGEAILEERYDSKKKKK